MMDLVVVEWIDAHSGKGWQDLHEIQDHIGPLYCRSVGWVVAKTAKYLMIVPHLSGERNGNVTVCGSGDLAIPISTIVKKTVLRKSTRKPMESS